MQFSPTKRNGSTGPALVSLLPVGIIRGVYAFLTGGSGYLGRNLLRHLHDRGWQVRALSRSPQSDATLRALGVEPVRGDLTSTAALQSGMTGADLVIHAAASTKEWAPQEEFYEVNVRGTERVLEAARNAKVPRLLHVSTEAVLLDGSPLVNVDESRPLPARPLPGYPRTKALAEERVRAANGRGIETVVVRPRFIWGRDDTTLLPKLVAMVRQGRFRWIGGGDPLTSRCHVDNACEGILLAATRGTPGAVYFLTDGPPARVRDFLTALLRAAGVEPPSGNLPFAVARTIARVGETVWRTFGWWDDAPPITQAAVLLIGQEVTVNDARARAEIGYRGGVSLEQGLQTLAVPSA